MISEKVVGYVWDYRFSLGIAVIIAIIIFLWGLSVQKHRNRKYYLEGSEAILKS